MLSSGCCGGTGDGYNIVQGCTKTHRPHARVLSRARHSVCGTTSEGRLNLIQYLWIEVGSFVPSFNGTHTTTLCSMVVCVPTDCDVGPDDSRRVGNVILPPTLPPSSSVLHSVSRGGRHQLLLLLPACCDCRQQWIFPKSTELWGMCFRRLW